MQFVIITICIAGFCGYTWSALMLLFAAPLWCNILGGAMLSVYLGIAALFVYLIVTDEVRVMKRKMCHGRGFPWGVLKPMVSCFCRDD